MMMRTVETKLLRTILIVLAILPAAIFLTAGTPVLAQPVNVCGSQQYPSQVAPGVPIWGKISTGGQQCWYTFYGSQGDLVEISMEWNSGNIDPYLILYPQNASPVINDDSPDGGTNSLIEYRLPYTGNYTVVAKSYSTDRWSTGSFWLYVNIYP